ncbi:hypothetical protein B0O80DRAFT_489013 [Mortierella sp. GBAus27b]|nr:hypothetical protein B0O80DRAFT_489013 [Mortierella sp. GBAus27b]
MASLSLMIICRYWLMGALSQEDQHRQLGHDYAEAFDDIHCSLAMSLLLIGKFDIQSPSSASAIDSYMMHDIPSPNRFTDTMPHSQLDDDKHSDANGTAPTLLSKATTTKTIDNRCVMTVQCREWRESRQHPWTWDFRITARRTIGDSTNPEQARVSSPDSKDSRKPGITTMMSSHIDHGFLDEDTTLTLNIIIEFSLATHGSIP